MKTTLIDGRTIELEPDDFNPFGQVYLSRLVERGIASSEWEMAELLGAAPCESRYGMVRPKVEIKDF